MTKLGWSGGPLPSSHRNWLSYRTGNQHTLIVQVIRDLRTQKSAKSVVLLVGSDPATNTTERAHLVCGKPPCVPPSLTTSCAQSRWHLLWPHTGHQFQRATALWSHCANRYGKTHTSPGCWLRVTSASLSPMPRGAFQCLSLLQRFIYYVW